MNFLSGYRELAIKLVVLQNPAHLFLPSPPSQRNFTRQSLFGVILLRSNPAGRIWFDAEVCYCVLHETGYLDGFSLLTVSRVLLKLWFKVASNNLDKSLHFFFIIRASSNFLKLRSHSVTAEELCDFEHRNTIRHLRIQMKAIARKGITYSLPFLHIVLSSLCSSSVVLTDDAWLCLLLSTVFAQRETNAAIMPPLGAVLSRASFLR